MKKITAFELLLFFWFFVAIVCYVVNIYVLLYKDWEVLNFEFWIRSILVVMVPIFVWKG